jgi:mitochondrial fission protein ELM1
VRIFLGSGPAHQRAERVFVWSIERLRDPSRVYEIHLLENLIGHRSRGWSPSLPPWGDAAPRQGRALYNEVDQIYLADPAELFDTQLEPHGLLADAADAPTVALLDCARIAFLWEPEAGRPESAVWPGARVEAVPGFRGELPARWRPRTGLDGTQGAGVVRFADPRTQPWRPFPERHVYQRDPNEALWLELERSADAAGFELFSRERPSARYVALGSPSRLEELPDADLRWRLDEILVGETAHSLTIECDPPGCRRADGTAQRSADWWVARLEAAAGRHSGVRWEAELRTPGRPTRRRAGGPRADGVPPRVWVLADDRLGNTTQSLGLADTLGWPLETKQVRPGPLSRLHNRLLGASRLGIDLRRSDPLEPPWPDLVIAAGRRTAPVALWIRERSGGRTRLVQLGRKGGDHAALFDLVATPAYCRLFPHPNRIEVSAPLHRVSAERLAEARQGWRQRIQAYPAPRIALLVGGSSGQYAMTVGTARAMAEAAAGMAREAGGSVLATTSRRTGEDASEALRRGLQGVPAWIHRPDDADENPYLGFLAFADVLVVSADSESMLAEATSLGRPVYVHPMPVRTSFRLLRLLREAVVSCARVRPAPPGRGHGHGFRLQHLCARLIERGFVRPTRDLEGLHDDLIRRGVARRVGAPAPPAWGDPLRENLRVAERVRALLGLAPTVGTDARPAGGPG